MVLAALLFVLQPQEPSTGPAPEHAAFEWALREPEALVPTRHHGFETGEHDRIVDLALASGEDVPWLFLTLRRPGDEAASRVRARRIGVPEYASDVFEAHAEKVLGRLVLPPRPTWVAVEALSPAGEMLGYYARDLGGGDRPRLGDLRWSRKGALATPSSELPAAALEALPRAALVARLERVPTGATVLAGVTRDEGRSHPWIAVSDDGRRFEGHFELPALPGDATAVAAAARGKEFWIAVAMADGQVEVLVVPLLRLRGAPLSPFTGLGSFAQASTNDDGFRHAWLDGPLTDVPPRDLAVRVLGAELGEAVAVFDPGGVSQLMTLVARVGGSGAVHCRTAGAPLAQRIAQHVAARGLGNVLVAAAESTVAPLPTGACDRVLLGDVRTRLLRGSEVDRSSLASALFATLRPGGRLVCVDAGSRGLRAGGWRESADAVRAVLASAGFEVGRAWIVHDASAQPRLVLDFRKPAGD